MAGHSSPWSLLELGKRKASTPSGRHVPATLVDPATELTASSIFPAGGGVVVIELISGASGRSFVVGKKRGLLVKRYILTGAPGAGKP